MVNGELIYCGDNSAEALELRRRLTGALSLVARAARFVLAETLRRRPLCVILDVGSKDREEILAACRGLKRHPRARRTPVILLCPCAETKLLLEGFEAGADHCLSRPFDPRVLLAHVHAMARNYQGYAAQAKLSAGPLSADPETLRVRVAGRQVRLTPSEFSILELLIARKGGLVSRSDIHEHIRKGARQSFLHAVETHVSNLRRKLGKEAGTRIENHSGVGYRLRTDEIN
ncbi:MAG: response regulator transcription factor [Elusimicrobiota bacterium]